MNQAERQSQVERLTDHEIIEHAKRLASTEWEAQLELIFHIGEIEKRRLHLDQGCSSVFDYLVRRLGYSESSAARRLATARAVRDYPRVYEGLVARQLNMSTIALLQRVLSPENEEELVAAALGRSQREVEALVARLRPGGVSRAGCPANARAEGQTVQVPRGAGRPAASPSRGPGMARAGRAEGCGTGSCRSASRGNPRGSGRERSSRRKPRRRSRAPRLLVPARGKVGP